MQQRQTVVFGTLIAALLVVGLLGGAMWSGVLPSPVDVPINSGAPPPEPEPVVPPCPPEEARPVPLAQVRVNVLNGTEESGLAAQTSAVLRTYGITVEREGNGAPYTGVAQITTGPRGVVTAYTISALFPSSQIVLDPERKGNVVDVLLGARYESVLEPEEAALDPETPIAAPTNCEPIEESKEK